MDFDSFEDFDNISENDLLEMMHELDNKEEEIENEPIKNKCINCGLENTLFCDKSNGISVCNKCGQVNNIIMDTSPEWKNKDGTSSNNRGNVPINQLLQQSSLGTTISGPCVGNIRKLHSWSLMPYRERSLYIVLKHIQSKCQKGHILKCIEDDAKIFYKSISESKHTSGKNNGKFVILRGKHRQSLIAACVYYACKKNKKSRSSKEIAELFDLDNKNMTRGCKTFRKLISMENVKNSISISSPEDYIYRYCKELRLNDECMKVAKKIAKNIKLLAIAPANTAVSIASASVMLTATMFELTIDRKTMAEKFKISELTMSRTYKFLEPYLDILIDDNKTLNIIDNMEKDRKNIETPKFISEKLEKFKEKYSEETDNGYETDNDEIKETQLELSEEEMLDVSIDFMKDIEVELNTKINLINEQFKQAINNI